MARTCSRCGRPSRRGSTSTWNMARCATPSWSRSPAAAGAERVVTRGQARRPAAVRARRRGLSPTPTTGWTASTSPRARAGSRCRCSAPAGISRTGRGRSMICASARTATGCSPRSPQQLHLVAMPAKPGATVDLSDPRLPHRRVTAGGRGLFRMVGGRPDDRLVARLDAARRPLAGVPLAPADRPSWTADPAQPASGPLAADVTVPRAIGAGHACCCAARAC